MKRQPTQLPLVAARTLAGFLLANALVAQSYNVTELGTVPGASHVMPAALNVHGTVVGSVQYPTAWQRAFVWAPASGLQLLPQPPGVPAGEPNIATHVNDVGDIVGYAGLAQQQGWLYRNGVYTMLGTRPGFTTSQAWRINNAGEVIGIVGNALGIDNFFRTAAGTMTDPTPGYYGPMHDLNDAGLACGSDLTGGATTWNLHQGTRTVHGFLPGYPDAAVGTAIDAAGNVAGYGWHSFASGPGLGHGFVLTPGLGLLDITGGPGRRMAMSRNTAGRVVGVDIDNQSMLTGGWTWTAGTGLVDLIALVPNPAQWTSVSFPGDAADALNEVGQILAFGRKPAGTYHALLLSPSSFSTPLGQGCAGSQGASTLTAISAPRLGQILHGRADRVPGAFGVLLVGANASSWGPIPLPMDLAMAGAPGCHLRTSVELLAPFVANGGLGTWSLAMPTDPSQIGLILHCQALLSDPTANAFGAVLSGAVAVRVAP